jgi:hypothetical protein
VSELFEGPPTSRREERRRRREETKRSRFVLVVVVLVVIALGTIVVVGGSAARRWWNEASPVRTPDPPLLPNAPTVSPQPTAAALRIDGRGYDISYPQCGDPLPKGGAFGIVGINGGAPLTSNKCLSEQFRWASGRSGYAVYINTANGGAADPVAYGRKMVDDAIVRERKAGVSGVSVWWLDVETTNPWKGTTQENATVLAAMAARLQELKVRVGIYSTPQQFSEIAGEWAPGLPVWNATGPGNEAAARQACSETFAGSSTAIAQWIGQESGRELDHNIICPAWRDRAGELLVPGPT